MSKKILLKPVITEKSMQDVAKGVYTFEVSPGSSKNLVKDALKNTFQVEAIAVRTKTIHTRGKRTGNKRILKPQTAKKYALVTLKKGQKLELFDLKDNQSTQGGK